MKNCGTCEHCLAKANGNCFCEVTKSRILNTAIDFNCPDYKNAIEEEDNSETIEVISDIMDRLVEVYEEQSRLMDEITKTFAILSKYREALEMPKEEVKPVEETPRTITLEELFSLLAQGGAI